MRALRFDWKLTLFTAALLPVLIWLGFWQLDRAGQKEVLQQRNEARRQREPVAPTAIDWSGDPAFMPLRASGRFDNAHHFLLDNRVHEGRVGYELITPFRTEGGILLVNRGWIAQGPTRGTLPPLPGVEGRVTINARVHVPTGQMLTLSDAREQAADAWPKVIQAVDISRMADQLPADTVYPYSVRLQPGSPGLLVPAWPEVSEMGPARHRGYALQWFALAAVLVLMFLYTSLRPREDTQ